MVDNKDDDDDGGGGGSGRDALGSMPGVGITGAEGSVYLRYPDCVAACVMGVAVAVADAAAERTSVGGDVLVGPFPP